MFGLYYKTIYRNQLTGETRFYIVPKVQCEHLNNGLLMCEGKIGIYLPNTPIEVIGEFKGNVYEVESDFIPYNTKENTISLLEYATDELTEKQKEKISEECDNDLFYFISTKTCYEKLANIIKNKNKEDQIISDIVYKISELKTHEDMTKELMSYGIGLDKIELLYKKKINLEKLENDVYMTFAMYDIPLDKADMFCNQNNLYEQYSINRLKGYVYFALNNILQAGNTCCTLKQLLNGTNYYLKNKSLEKTEIDMSVLYLCLTKLDKVVTLDFFEGEIYVYIKHVYEEEIKTIRNIKRLINNKTTFEFNEKDIDIIEDKFNIYYNKEQKNAFNSLKTSGVKILTGPPGSGKTATINGLIASFAMHNKGNIKLAATTGMASKVMSKACNKETETVNIMLNVIPYQDTATGKNLNDPIDADLIIVDEISMIGLQLFSILVDATTSGSILILVGDEDQLQSVEYGNILHDLIKSGLIEVYRLTEILRQSGVICSNAKKINKGETDLVVDSTFNIYYLDDSMSIIEKIKENINNKNYQILVPIKGSPIGTESLNNVFQKKKGSILLTYGSKNFYYKDKIIMTKTNYEHNYINGDIGYVVGVDDEQLIVKFLDKTLLLEREDLCNVEFAYAITVHKSQGSEFDEVHIVLPNDAKNMLIRRILYTAITRTKKKLYIYTLKSDDCINYAISNEAETKRVSLLSKKLKIMV